jgi:catalase
LKLFKTNDFAQAGERYHSLDKDRQKNTIGDLVADLSHVTIPAIQRRENEDLRQAERLWQHL